jgi:hypothetical protein
MARGGAEAGQRERDRLARLGLWAASARLGEREKPPPPKLGLGMAHMWWSGEKRMIHMA